MTHCRISGPCLFVLPRRGWLGGLPQNRTIRGCHKGLHDETARVPVVREAATQIDPYLVTQNLAEVEVKALEMALKERDTVRDGRGTVEAPVHAMLQMGRG